MGAERGCVLFLILEPIHSPETRVAGSRAQTARPPPRKSTAPTTALPNTHAPVPQQPRRPHGLAALPGPGHAPPACATQTTRRRSLTPTASLCRRPRSRRSPGELRQCTAGAAICWGLPGGRGCPEGGRDGATGSRMGSENTCLMDAWWMTEGQVDGWMEGGMGGVDSWMMDGCGVRCRYAWEDGGSVARGRSPPRFL